MKIKECTVAYNRITWAFLMKNEDKGRNKGETEDDKNLLHVWKHVQ